MERRIFLKSAMVGAAGFMLKRFGQSAVENCQKTINSLNVLFIVSDDMNTAIGSYNDPIIQTPHLDRLSRQGIQFNRAYCQYPLCGPSRTSMLTGIRPDTMEVWSNETHFRTTDSGREVVTLPQLFRQQGFFTGRVGKIFHAGVPDEIGQDGQDDKQSWDQTVNPVGRDKLEENQVINYTPNRGLGNSLSFLSADGEDEEQTDGMVATEIIQMMEQNRNRPFFLAAGFYRPHCPYVAPKKYFDLYPIEKVMLPTVPDNYRETIPAMAFYTKPANWGLTEQQCKEVIQAYYASATFMDAQVGRLLDALERLKLADNTLVVFVGDHGYQLSHHDGQWKKMALWEQAVRTPLIISGANLKGRGQATERIVELLDIYPTLADLCGLPIPDHVKGRSLRPLLNNPKVGWNYPAFSQVRFGGRRGYSVRVQRWRFTEWNEGRQGLELYDHNNDTEEIYNLAKNPDYSDVIAELSSKIQAMKG